MAAAMSPTASVWEDVPDNILLRLAAYLPSRGDRIRMSFVNTHWSRALRGEGRGRPPQLPLMPPLLPCLIFPNTEAPTFFCAIDGRSYPLPLPLPRAVRHARLCGSGVGGWLVLALDTSHTHTLYNIYSGERIRLPPGVNFPDSRNLPLVLRVVTLLFSPTSHRGYMIGAIILVGARRCPAFWQEGLQNWITPDQEDLWMGRPPQDVIRISSGFYFVTTDERVVVYRPVLAGDNNELRRIDFDMVERQDYEDDLLFIGGNGSMVRYLVEIWGWLHMVVRYIYSDGGTEVLRVFRFHIMQQTAYGRPFRATWVGVQALDGQMPFVGRGCSRSIEVAQFHGFEDSTIYFPDDSFTRDPEYAVDNRRRYSFFDMGRYSMYDKASLDESWPPEDRRPAWSDSAPCTWWFH